MWVRNVKKIIKKTQSKKALSKNKKICDYFIMTSEMELRKRRRGDLIKFIDLHNIKNFKTLTKPKLIELIMKNKSKMDFSKLPPVAKDRRAEEKAKQERKIAREKRRIATKPQRKARRAVLAELKDKTKKYN